MGFHDTLAEAAFRDGDQPEAFRLAAQRHANAFWGYLAIAAAVWYFAGWHWALIPLVIAALVVAQSVSATLTARKLEALRAAPLGIPPRFDLNKPDHVVLINEIRSQYSVVLADESSAYASCMYRPAALLPFTKDEIRRALTALLEFAEGRRASNLLNRQSVGASAAASINAALGVLDDFLEIAPSQLPTDPQQNLRVGSQVQRLGDATGRGDKSSIALSGDLYHDDRIVRALPVPMHEHTHR